MLPAFTYKRTVRFEVFLQAPTFYSKHPPLPFSALYIPVI
jgi:hypothetical protein